MVGSPKVDGLDQKYSVKEWPSGSWRTAGDSLFRYFCLVKLYVKEEHSLTVEQAVFEAEIVATHLIAYVEVQAAFARLFREGVISEEILENIQEDFKKDWPHYMKIGLNQSLLERASDFAKAFALKAYDSIHLAVIDLLLKTAKDKDCFVHNDNAICRLFKLFN
ncbi:hypothetical protein Thein_1569 [Thermodesulfatator indicus DSM 15286]|uniref:PIN domain-containing protein n=1 Tax=Thermodesulfatator indicus (strain DSM 15286 / JCM 11887 / CIR29812) TaxID=667014 RepID=F8AAR9_THEID|nr:hypothetical protein Thein_1569 [Thermodesulfatator indicus DSM 15286]